MPLLAAMEAVMSALRGWSVRKSKRSNGGVNTRSLYLCFFDHVIFRNTSEHSFLEGRRLPPGVLSYHVTNMVLSVEPTCFQRESRLEPLLLPTAASLDLLFSSLLS